jgi:hypothetical protein
MLRRPLTVLLPAAAVAAVAVGGCGASPAPSAGQPAAATVSAPAASPSASPTCKQQADAWKAANAGLIKRFERALTPFSSGSVTSTQAHKLAATAKAMDAAAVPACTDPRGYYTQAMANLETAGQAAEGGGALAELGAMTPMENALTALNEFQAELEHNAGLHKL